METTAPDSSHQSTEPTAGGEAGEEPDRACNDCTQNDNASAANDSNYLSDHMSPNTDEQQRSTNGVTSGSGGSGQNS